MPVAKPEPLEADACDGVREPADGAAEVGVSPLFSLALWPALAFEEGAAVVAVEDVDVFGW
jgi:hypothetical protein